MSLQPCSKCGQQISSEADACPNCGNKNPEKKKSPLWVVALVVPIIVAAIIGGQHESKPTNNQTAPDANTARLENLYLNDPHLKSIAPSAEFVQCLDREISDLSPTGLVFPPKMIDVVMGHPVYFTGKQQEGIYFFGVQSTCTTQFLAWTNNTCVPLADDMLCMNRADDILSEELDALGWQETEDHDPSFPDGSLFVIKKSGAVPVPPIAEQTPPTQPANETEVSPPTTANEKLPYPQSLKNVITVSDWPKVRQALAFAYSLGDQKDYVQWANSKTGSGGSVFQSGDGADPDGCRQFRVVNQSKAGPPVGLIEVCPSGRYK